MIDENAFYIELYRKTQTQTLGVNRPLFILTMIMKYEYLIPIRECLHLHASTVARKVMLTGNGSIRMLQNSTKRNLSQLVRIGTAKIKYYVVYNTVSGIRKSVGLTRDCHCWAKLSDCCTFEQNIRQNCCAVIISISFAQQQFWYPTESVRPVNRSLSWLLGEPAIKKYSHTLNFGFQIN